MAHVVSRKLSNSFEGALAGGGDPATSPLYVFGPFLKLIVVAGVAQITFGASVWLVVLTIAMVSAMYRLVMRWVTDGSGGSGLTEEEFGGWAVKINAGITFIEYTLTFLVSMAALVTFIADRLPLLNEPLVFGLNGRVVVAILLSVMTGWLVNLGPKVAARAFGPATGAVLALLWLMNFATIWKTGLHLPAIHWQAFVPPYVHFTLAGYSRILAVMTGIEVFANLVAAYEGTPEERSRKAFGSLLIIMGTTSATMLITGPAIFKLADPTNEHVSVFTQTMDQLLPDPLPYLGTLVGIAVLLSASAASAQGLQNLALGLKDRHYIPPILGRRNKYDVADMPVWIEVAIASFCFLFLGTSEETYLSIYAAGVFILLSMTGWAATKRLKRELEQEHTWDHWMTLIGTIIAAFLTSLATVIIFAERFSEGAWTYFLFVPLLYVLFTYFRNRLGAPSPLQERLGELEEAMWGVGTPLVPDLGVGTILSKLPKPTWPSLPKPGEGWRGEPAHPHHILVPLDGTEYSERVLPVVNLLAERHHADVTLASVLVPHHIPVIAGLEKDRRAPSREERLAYLQKVAQRIHPNGRRIDTVVETGPVAETLDALARRIGADLMIISTHGRRGWRRLLASSTASRILHMATIPVLIVPPGAEHHVENPSFLRILVPLDGSENAERVLPYVRGLKGVLDVDIILLYVPEVPRPEGYGAIADVVEHLRRIAITEGQQYLERIANVLREEGLNARPLVLGYDPARTILQVSKDEDIDVIMSTTQGRGALERFLLGSVAEQLAAEAQSLLFLLPVRNQRRKES